MLMGGPSTRRQWLLAAAMGAGAASGLWAGEPRQRQRRPGRPAERQRPRPAVRAQPQHEEEDETQATEEGMPAARMVLPEGPEARKRFWAGRWRLGVFAYNTPTGVVITRVLPGSAAARAGLEPRDVIVTVGGYQVGFVEHQLYPLGEELQLRADPSGRVTLLVQNCRNDQLIVLPVRLQRYGPVWRQR